MHIYLIDLFVFLRVFEPISVGTTSPHYCLEFNIIKNKIFYYIKLMNLIGLVLT